MKKQANYIHIREMRERCLSGRWLNESSPHNAKLQALVNQLISSEKKRQGLERDEPRTKRVTEEYYEMLCTLAEINGGRTELDWNESYNIATLTYWGKEMILDKNFSSETERFAALLWDCDTIIFSTEGNYFKLFISFDLTKKAFP